MKFGLFDILTIVGALCFFIFGMKMMSDGIQRAAGSQLRNILRSMTKNRFLGVFTGFLTTSVVQSSSATTVMTVSFVNAGLLTLVESAGVMMGANIGTTVTGWIISILGLKVKLSTYSIPLFALGLPLFFSDRGKLKHWGEFVIGFAILFLGLTFLKDAVPQLDNNADQLNFLTRFADWGFFSRVLFVLLGALVTVIVQSSSAAMAVTLTLCYQGWLPLEVGASMILGENIGTTITAEIASLVGNTNAKRSARIHSLFNIIGVTWMIILMPWILDGLREFVTNFSSIFEGHFDVDDPQLDNAENRRTTYTLAAFHTVFNLLNVTLMLPFVNWLVRASIATVPDKSGKDATGLRFIGTAAKTAELAIVEVQKETAHFGQVVSRMNDFAKELLNETIPKKQKKLHKKLKKYEKISDEMEIEITNYITKVAREELTRSMSKKLRSILNVCNDLERIGDIYFQISKTIEQKNDTSAYFTPDQRDNINSMYDLIAEAFSLMIANLGKEYDKVGKEEAMEIENTINKLRNKLRKHNLDRIGDDDYNIQSAFIYNNLFSALEKVGDHIVNVTESLVGEI